MGVIVLNLFKKSRAVNALQTKKVRQFLNAYLNFLKSYLKFKLNFEL